MFSRCCNDPVYEKIISAVPYEVTCDYPLAKQYATSDLSLPVTQELRHTNGCHVKYIDKYRMLVIIIDLDLLNQ